jgi:hypothetical protein
MNPLLNERIAHMTQPDANGTNSGHAFVRVALVHDPGTTVAGLSRLAEALGLSAVGAPAAASGTGTCPPAAAELG